MMQTLLNILETRGTWYPENETAVYRGQVRVEGALFRCRLSGDNLTIRVYRPDSSYLVAVDEATFRVPSAWAAAIAKKAKAAQVDKDNETASRLLTRYFGF